MSQSLRYTLLALAIASASSYAPAGPDNLSSEEAAAVQRRLDLFTLFPPSAPGDAAKKCLAWAEDAFTSNGQFNHPPPLGSFRGTKELVSFCTQVQPISKVQEMRQDGPYTWVATDSNHTQLDVLLPGLYLNDAPFAKTFNMLLRMTKVPQTGEFMIKYGSEILTTTKSDFTFPAN